MSRIIFIYSLLFIGILASCDQTETNSKKEAPIIVNIYDTLKIPAPTRLRPKLKLTPEALSAIENWTFYKTLVPALDSLSGPTLGQLRPQISKVYDVFENKNTADEAEVNTTPDGVETKAIQSRILAIQTQLNVLRNKSELNTPNPSAISMSIQKTKNGLQDLNLQLNERFSMSIKEMLEDIKKEDGDSLPLPQTPSLQLPPSIQNN